MLRNVFTAAAFSLVLACGSVFAADAAQEQAQAQQEAMAAAVAAMANQPPIAQADIDAFLTLTPKIAAAQGDQAAVLKLIQDAGIAPERFGLIGTKISVGMMLTQGVTREQLAGTGQFPDVMFPNDAEAALIKDNLDAIMKAAGAAAQ